MPKLISFDIGIRNLAYCIFDISSSSTISILDWNVLDISLKSKENENQIMETKTCNYNLTSKKGEGKLCCKKAKYQMDKDSLCFCEKHAKISGYCLPLHLFSFKTPTEGAEMSEERRTNCASLMRNGVKEFEKTQIKKLSVNSLDAFILKWKIQEGDLGEKKIAPKSEKVEYILQWIQSHVLQKIGDVGEPKKKGPLDFIQIGRNMADHLSKMDLDDIQYVVIENQISPIANKMRTIQGMVAQMFILQKVPTIEFVSSSNKLREYLGESKTAKKEKKEEEKEKKEDKKEENKKEKDKIEKKEEKIEENKKEKKEENKKEKDKIEENEKKGKKDKKEKDKGVNPDYKQHKKEAINYTRQWLESPKSGFSNWKTFFDTYPKKQDDLADAFLQGIWYLRKKMMISLEK